MSEESLRSTHINNLAVRNRAHLVERFAARVAPQWPDIHPVHRRAPIKGMLRRSINKTTAQQATVMSARKKSSPPSFITTIPRTVKWLTIAPLKTRWRAPRPATCNRARKQKRRNRLEHAGTDATPRLEADLGKRCNRFRSLISWAALANAVSPITIWNPNGPFDL